MAINASFLGNLGRTAEVKQSQKGPVTVFSVAVRGREKDSTEWVDCSIFGERGVKLSQYLEKGAKVYVSGKLTRTTFTYKNGESASRLNVAVDDLEFASSKKDEKAPPSSNHQPEPSAPFDPLAEIPF